ncbi:CU044_2847 family protein [Streptomyces sp. Tue6028]|uniref:CU044_2847 family protein n=1 Tax=Streptomyces sp. Tue6028 TaxID=2036037 RepID=UPI003EBF7B39
MAQAVAYELDDSTVVRFELEPSEEWRQVSSDDVVARVRDAVRPAVDAARTVLERVTELKPGEVEVKFGVKVSGTANWIVAKAATDAHFEITLTWTPTRAAGEDSTPA